MRLNRFLSLCGLGSRRGVENLVREGRVTVNGSVVNELAVQIGDDDAVTVDGRPVRPEKPIVLVLNKPKGYLCTREDTHERATIYDLLPLRFQKLHHVGRLDKDSEGLILLTNRGDLSHRLLHPSEGVEKEYEVRLEKEFDPTHVPKLIHGVMTAEGFAKAERVYVESVWKVNVVLKQGLKRQIRLMFYEIGYEVERLVRTRIGGLKLYGLPKGGWKELSEAEVERYFFAPMRGAAKERAARAKAAPKADQAEVTDDDLAPRRSLLKERGGKTSSGPRPRRPGGVGPAKGKGPGGRKPYGKSATKSASKSYEGKQKPSRTKSSGDERPAGARKRFALKKQQNQSRRGPGRPAGQKPGQKGPRHGGGNRPSGR